MNEQIIIKYISAWMWFLISQVFLAATMILLALKSFYLMVITIILTAVSFKFAFDRKFKVEDEEDEN